MLSSCFFVVFIFLRSSRFRFDFTTFNCVCSSRLRIRLKSYCTRLYHVISKLICLFDFFSRIPLHRLWSYCRSIIGSTETRVFFFVIISISNNVLTYLVVCRTRLPRHKPILNGLDRTIIIIYNVIVLYVYRLENVITTKKQRT